jgi:hypothetical protein
MSRRPPNITNRSAALGAHAAIVGRGDRSARPLSKRTRGGQRNERLPFAPPEDWYEPQGDTNGFRFVVQDAGTSFRHVLSADEIRQRLSVLPEKFVAPLEVVQLSRMTRKKRSFLCYGMQWGAAIYLYPIEEELVEYYDHAPNPNQMNEARMFGGRWTQDRGTAWRLVWSERAIKDFYLNNILIHELGHLLDGRNSSYVDRERYAEWFALEFGYKPSRTSRGRSHQRVVRRHHSA